jgi:hypothetical protein
MLLVFARSLVRIPVVSPNVLINMYRDFPQSLQENIGIVT